MPILFTVLLMKRGKLPYYIQKKTLSHIFCSSSKTKSSKDLYSGEQPVERREGNPVRQEAAIRPGQQLLLIRHLLNGGRGHAPQTQRHALHDHA